MHPLSYRLFIFDKDQTLTQCTVPNQPCPNNRHEWEFMPNVIETLAHYDWSRQSGCHLFSMATNQGGVAHMFMTEETAHDICESVKESIIKYLSVSRDAFLYDMAISYKSDDPKRKPNPGMLWNLMMDFGVSRFETLFVGDSPSDQEAARNAGCDYMDAAEFFGWK